MLPEIFDTIGENIFKHFEAKKIKLRNTKILSDTTWKTKHLRIELLRFGNVSNSKSFPVTPPLDNSLYAFTIFIIANIPDYSDCLRFTELICDYFYKKPFLQLKIDEQEFEIAISALELSIEELNQFWMTQNQPHQPVLFYQARISEI
ncbi:MAG TPA: hypothetical protein VKA49_00435 [Flavitalea sp.]|nr:hypothetical protein [Flavitalea sp.]